MKKFLLLLIWLIGSFTVKNVYAQGTACVITVSPMNTTICPGDSVLITATGGLVDANGINDFNDSILPPGWSATGATQFTAPCIPSLDSTAYYWASTSTGVPGVTTGVIDASCGGLINFEMIFAVQSGPTPCEGPDQSNEGVSLQYSLNGGLTWVDIIYYSPGGFTLPTNPNTVSPTYSGATAYTVWNTFSVPIPVLACTPNTQFRWTQSTTSGSCCDNWGIDNILINTTGLPCNTTSVINWSTGLMDTSSFYMVPSSDTAFVGYVYDTLGVLQCVSDTVHVKLFGGNFTFNLPPSNTVYCPGALGTGTVTGITSGAKLPVTYNWFSSDSTSYGTLPTGNLPGANSTPSDTTYYVTVTDACGFPVTDSISIIVNQTLWIDTISHVDQSNCSPNGSAHVVASGNQGAVQYQWTAAPGATGNTSSITANMTSLSPGWYYVTVSDNVCSDMDSVEIGHFDVDLFDFNLADTLYVNCPGASANASITGLIGAVGPITYTWTNSANTDTVISTSATFPITSSPTNITDMVTYYVTAVEACGYIEKDSVVLVTTQTDNLTYSLPDTVTKYCPNATQTVNVIVTSGSTAPITYNWSNGSTTSSSLLTSSDLEHDTIEYSVTFTDACLRTRTDTVVFIIDKKLNVSSLTQIPTTSCHSDGSVNASYTGVTGSPITLWQDSLNYTNTLTGNSQNSNLWSNIGSGWYYFTVTDNVCTDTDSIFLDMLDPPVADFTINEFQGCTGLSVNIVNTSENTTYYEWDFGNGNTETSTTNNNFTEQYFQNGEITLYAYMDASKTCGASHKASIEIHICGCTDPNSTNYNPLADWDDESCIHPTPTAIVPNVFTPNGDGGNELFFIETINAVELKLTITNRWGNIMYDKVLDLTANVGAQGWDGRTPLGIDAENGTYFYTYEAKGVSNDIINGSGFLQLIRK